MIIVCVAKTSQTDNVAVRVMWREWFDGGWYNMRINARPASKIRSMRFVCTTLFFHYFYFFPAHVQLLPYRIVSLGKVQRVVEHKMLVLLVWNRKIETPVWSRLLKLFKFPVSNRAMEYLREIFLVTFPPSRIMVASLGSSSKYHKPLRWNEMIDISLSSLFISHLCTFLTCLIFSPHSLLLSSHQSSTNIFFPEYTYRIRASSHFISDSWFNMRDIDQY